MNIKKKFLLNVIILFSQLFIAGHIWAQRDNSILIGAEYFNGWWEESPNKWEHRGKDWRLQFPERIPLLGEYNSQETMDKEIEAAAKYGIDFFSILWYYPGQLETDVSRERSDLLNSGLNYFMNSPQSDKMKFMVELCNHAPFSIITDEDWENCMDVCVEAMKHPSYLRIEGRPVLKIHSAHQFFVDNEGDIKRSRQIVKRLRQKSLKNGVGELLIMVGTYGTDRIDHSNLIVRTGEIDGTMQYMDPTDLPQTKADYSYDRLTERAQEVWNARKNDVIPHVPYFPAGWNPKPWNDPRASFHFPNREQLKTSLENLKTELLTTPTFGFPKKDGTTQKAFTFYAWNEWGEGGYIAPTRGDQYMKLETIKEVFNAHSRHQ